MGDPYCPNINICKLVITKGFTGDEEKRYNYIQNWCRSGKKKWSLCKRYITKESIHFCPDFVLPDTELTLDEIIDKFDKETNNQ